MAQDDVRLLLRIPEAAQRLALGRSTVYELIAKGELPVVRVGAAVRVPASALSDWVERQTSEPGGPAGALALGD
jgi:excisionase family DNA binding protein